MNDKKICKTMVYTKNKNHRILVKYIKSNNEYMGYFYEISIVSLHLDNGKTDKPVYYKLKDEATAIEKYTVIIKTLYFAGEYENNTEDIVLRKK